MTGDIVAFVENLGTKSPDVRKQMLGARMVEFMGMPPPQRKQAIAGLLNALGEVSESTRVKVVDARTQLLIEAPKENQQILMGVLKEVMSGWSPQRKQMEKQAVTKATEDYFFLKKRIVRKKFAALLQ